MNCSKLLLVSLSIISIAWVEGVFVKENGKSILKQVQHVDPTNHFDWMPALHHDEVANQPEWNYIHFGHNQVRWLTFRRGNYGAWWNPWEPGSPTNEHAVILQSEYEPVAIKTNGVWIITFRKYQ